MWKMPYWKKIGEDPQVVKVKVHQCMAGLIGPRSGLPNPKPTVFWVSDELLVKPLRSLQCDKSHKHGDLDGSDPFVPQDRASDMARWPQPLCRRLADM